MIYKYSNVNIGVKAKNGMILISSSAAKIEIKQRLYRQERKYDLNKIVKLKEELHAKFNLLKPNLSKVNIIKNCVKRYEDF
ncbi:MAG: hypothetical protein U5J96_05965 [Ignavibacteriaceae bacterium]|nr:hypothetical protein [Ignavibacteriaceae bacterium]